MTARHVYWRDTEHVQAGPPLSGRVRGDVCVVGGGYTGLWTAHQLALAEPGLVVHVVEAEYAGAGASGHNDGFVTPTVGKDLQQLVAVFGLERTAAVTAAVGQSVLEIGRFCRRFGVDADYEPNGYLMVATDDAQLARLGRDHDLAARMGGRGVPRLLDAGEARARIGSPVLRGAMPVGGALVNPHRLARGLARTVREQGVAVHERTPALGIAPAGGGWEVATPGGSVTARTVVVATDGYQHLFPQFRRGSVPIWSYAMTTEPLTAGQLARVEWPGREGLVEARTFLHCARLTADDRILWAGGPIRHFLRGNMREEHTADRAAYRRLRAEFERFFPMWRDVRTSHAYGGRMAVTADLVPHFGRFARGLCYGYGYCGNGIAASHLGGKVLRDLVLERDTEYAALPFVDRAEARLPRAPLDFAGVHYKRWTLDRHDRRRPAPAGQAPPAVQPATTAGGGVRRGR